MKQITLLILALSILFSTYAQKKDIKIANGSAQIEFPDYKSRVEVEEEAEKFAKINALEKAFGKVIIQGNSTYIKNINTGKKVETNSSFSMIANTYVKGEVVEVIDKKITDVKGYTIIDDKKVEVTEIKCDIKVKVRELVAPPIDYEVYTLSYTNKRSKTTSFISNDTLYLYFKSPVNGYLSVFLDDTKNSQRLLPYNNMPSGYDNGIPIKADKEYIFFSTKPQFDYFKSDNFKADIYQLYAESAQDLNRLFIVFSKEPFDKPALKDNINREKLTEAEIKGGHTMPKALESTKFQKWLNNNKIFFRDLQVKIIDITISR